MIDDEGVYLPSVKIFAGKKYMMMMVLMVMAMDQLLKN